VEQRDLEEQPGFTRKVFFFPVFLIISYLALWDVLRYLMAKTGL